MAGVAIGQSIGAPYYLPAERRARARILAVRVIASPCRGTMVRDRPVYHKTDAQEQRRRIDWKARRGKPPL